MDQIIKLLQDYKEYNEKGIPEDLGLFGEWLKQKYADASTYKTDREAVDQYGIDVMASYFLCGLGSFVDHWLKLSFQELPLVSLGDFGIIKKVEHYGNPSKKMIADALIMERTTCIESIKRLTKKGLLTEKTDKEDQRMKRVSLTPYGQEVSAQLNIKMSALGSLLVGNLNEVEKKSLVPILKKLVEFHDYLYRKKDKEEVKALYNL